MMKVHEVRDSHQWLFAKTEFQTTQLSLQSRNENKKHQGKQRITIQTTTNNNKTNIQMEQNKTRTGTEQKYKCSLPRVQHCKTLIKPTINHVSYECRNAHPMESRLAHSHQRVLFPVSDSDMGGSTFSKLTEHARRHT